MKIDLTLTEDQIMDLGEECQETSICWMPCWSRGHTLQLACPPFQCREFLADWVFHVLDGTEGEVYGWRTNKLVPKPHGYTGLKYLAAYSDDGRGEEEEVLGALCTAVIGPEDQVQEDDAGYSRPYNAGRNPFGSKIFVFEIPDWAKDPFGMLLWTLSIRSQAEVGEVTPWPFPEKPQGNLYEMLVDACLGKDNDYVTRYLSDLYQCMPSVNLPKVSDHGTRIGSYTHEYFSPMTVLSSMLCPVTRDRNHEWGKDNPIMQYRMQVVEDLLSAMEGRAA